MTMIDIHSHILPGVDDGAADLPTALEMARMAVADGVEVQACTPHILPGLYHNTGPQIRAATQELQRRLDDSGIALRLVPGADVHLVPDIATGLRSGRILSLADTRYVLVEPPHHVAPLKLVDFFFGVLVAGYVPILTHPERLSWIDTHYASIERLFHGGVWMQITAGSLLGAFGRAPRYWAERMLDEGFVHILASDAHGVGRRRPNLGQGREAVAKRLGSEEAVAMVRSRPLGILENLPPSQLPRAAADDGQNSADEKSRRSKRRNGGPHAYDIDNDHHGDVGGWRDFVGRVRTIFQ
jgi:protein-tyrosine phosphatase